MPGHCMSCAHCSCVRCGGRETVTLRREWSGLRNEHEAVSLGIEGGIAGMNPFPRLWLIRATRYFNHKEGVAYDQTLKSIRRARAGSRRSLSSLRWSHGSGAGARTRLVRLALCQLRRADRSGDSRPSSAARCGAGRWTHRYQPETILSQLTRRPAGTGERCRSPFGQGRQPRRIQGRKQPSTIRRIERALQRIGASCG